MDIVKLSNNRVLFLDGNRIRFSISGQCSAYLDDNQEEIVIKEDGTTYSFDAEDVENIDNGSGLVPFNGNANTLLTDLNENFFKASSGTNVGGGGKILYMVLDSIQDLNVIQPFTDLDFIEASNTIPNATVSSNFPIGPETYKGVVTLPPGKYKTSYRINCQNGSNTQKVVVTNISRYAPSVIFYPESTSYQIFRGNNNFASITNSDANYQFFELTQAESFGIISARTAAAGAVNTIAEQSFWKIEKIG